MKERGQGSPEGAPKKGGRAPQKEQGRVQKESTANNSLVSPVEQKLSDKLTPTPAGEKKIERHNPERAVFDCVVPLGGPYSLHDVRWMLRDQNITEEEAQEMEQEWREYIKSLNRQELENELMHSESRLASRIGSKGRGGITALGEALLPELGRVCKLTMDPRHSSIRLFRKAASELLCKHALEQEVEEIREELLRRKDE